MTPEVLWSFGRIGNVSVSPDGSKAVYDITYFNKEEDRGYSDLYLMNLPEGQTTRLTDTDYNESDAGWTPDGKFITYLAKGQLWEMNPDGSNPRQVTDIPDGINGYVYAPDMSKIVYLKDVQLEPTVQDLYPDLPKAKARIVDDQFYRHWNDWVDAYTHLFIADYVPAQPITTGKDIMEGERWESPVRPWGGVEQLAWTKDGKKLIYTCRKKIGIDYAESTNTDLYAYNTKHNEKNGWNNSDGDNNGNSWNCGAEGETDDPQIEGLRLRMVKNACATLMCSRGPAMFYAGDEFCNTQFGNNNAYCQDNIISWLDWTRLEKYQEIHDFFRYMIAFREKYPILRRSTKKALCGLPEISIHNGFPWNGGTDYTSKLIGIMYAGRDDADTRDDIIFYGMNAYWETLVMQLPELPNNLQWKICVNTNIEYEDGKDVEAQTEFYYKKTLKVPPRSVVILVAE